MPCEKCEKKWGKIITPEVWRDGAKSSHKNSKLGENKFLTKVKNGIIVIYSKYYYQFKKLISCI